MHHSKAIYSTWGLHDELGDHVRLTEELATAAFESLLTWRSRHGIRQDIFHLDCFWFDPERGFNDFHPQYWPRGFAPLLNRIRAAGMAPGLWYSTNGSWLKPKAWSASLGSCNWHHSLIHGPYAELFEQSLLHAAEQWGVRFYKFDFAVFHTAVAGTVTAPQEVYRQSFSRFVSIISRLRAAYPDVEIITHCGFARGRFDEEAPAYLPPAVDPSLLGLVDRVFSADPHTFDIPQTQLARNIDLHQDRQVWHLHQAGFPLHRIEDHGAVIATTNTGHYRGRSGFPRTHLAQLARGGRRDMFYGDPRVLTDADLTHMKAARALFFDAWQRNLETCFIGPGEPGQHPWHGWLTGGGHRGLLYLVNATCYPQLVRLPITSALAGRVLYADGAADAAALQVQHDLVQVELGPEAAVLIGLGEYAEAPPLSFTNDPPAPRHCRLLPVSWRYLDGSHDLHADIPALEPGERLLVTVQVDSAKPEGVATGAYRFGPGHTKTPQDTMEPQTAKLIEISVTEAGQPLAAVSRVPGVPVWSSISWINATFAPTSATQVTIRCHLDPKRKLAATVMAIR